MWAGYGRGRSKHVNTHTLYLAISCRSLRIDYCFFLTPLLFRLFHSNVSFFFFFLWVTGLGMFTYKKLLFKWILSLHCFTRSRYWLVYYFPFFFFDNVNFLQNSTISTTPVSRYILCYNLPCLFYFMLYYFVLFVILFSPL